MGKENLDESDKPTEAAGTPTTEARAPSPPLAILAIDDDPGMLRFYEVALADERCPRRKLDGPTSCSGAGGNPQSRFDLAGPHDARALMAWKPCGGFASVIRRCGSS